MKFWDNLYGRRGEKGLPKVIKFLNLSIISFFAKRRRAKGYYDNRTLAMFRYIWLKSGTIKALLDYVLFRRDLGFPLHLRWQSLLDSGLTQLNLSQQRRARLLLAEVLSNLANDDIKQLFNQDSKSLNLYHKQSLWQHAFSKYIAQKNICVVGNSSVLLNSGLGTLINQHTIAVRFNNFRHEKSKVSDIGSKTDVWVVAPDYIGDIPDVNWVVVSGADMLFQRQNWGALSTINNKGTPILTIPLVIWKSLVKQLQAPPSAGLLFLAGLKIILGSWSNITVVGFSISALKDAPYHHLSSKYKAGERHNWAVEQEIMQQWQLEGLKIY